MKVLFLNTEILSKEMLQKLASCTKKEKDCCNHSYLITLHESISTTEDLLRELNVSKETIEEISGSDLDKFLIILNDGIRFKGLNTNLNYDFKKSGNLEYKNFNINLDEKEVYINNKRARVTMLEYKLLLFFIYNAKRTISRGEIINYLWGTNNKQPAPEVTLYTHIKNLKKKLIKSGVNNFIHSIYGQGYKFEDPKEVVS